ncbi:MAG: sugar ABC transporter substrate-binding protein [Chloroflexi bacterium]|nr:sugar ABC transporter substrate-binding protein [Chloroflexota bacterium]
MKRRMIVMTMIALSILVLILVSCATPAPQVVTKEVTVEVVKEVEVTPSPGESWTGDEIRDATGKWLCDPVAEIPKELEQEWVVGYINMDKSHPFFSQWDAGMADAAEFYGAKFIGMDASNGASIDQLDPLLAQNPDIIGSQKDMDAIAAAALDEGIPYLNIDEGQTEYSPYVYGVPNAVAGKLAGEKLVEGLKERMEGDWQGKELFFLEFTHGGVPACVTRTAASAQAVKDGMGLDDDHILMQDPFAIGTTPPDMLLATLTANPDAVFGLIPCWDALGIEPYNAARESGREGDILMVTQGADQPTLEFLKSKPVGYYGVLQFKPYCEGWSWLETTLAIQEGIPFRPYTVNEFVSQDNIEERYQELYSE